MSNKKGRLIFIEAEEVRSGIQRTNYNSDNNKLWLADWTKQIAVRFQLHLKMLWVGGAAFVSVSQSQIINTQNTMDRRFMSLNYIIIIM